MSSRSRFYQPVDEDVDGGGVAQSLSFAASSPSTTSTGSGGTEKRLGRKSWRTMGIRLNTEMTLQNIRITDVRLGSGSFGARDVRAAEWCGTRVAAKTLLPPKEEYPNSPAESSLDFGRNITPYQRRVLQECNLMGRLCHPHIAQLHGVFIDTDGRPVIISELLSESLAQRIAFGPRLSFRDVLDVSTQVLSALTYLHSLPHPVVHGSLCSSNVLMSISGVVKLTDTNLALAKLYCPSSSHSSSANPPQLDVPAQQHQRGGGGSPSSLSSSCAQHSENAERYLPLLSLRDCYETSVDCFSFAVLLMAMLLHREPLVTARPHATPNASTTTAGMSTVLVSELERRADDLEALRQVAPLIEPLVTVCIDDGFMHTNGHQSPGHASSSRPSIHEIRKNVEGIKSSDEYHRWPCTLGSPFLHGAQRQVELEATLRTLQQQVEVTVNAAQVALDEQSDKMSQHVKHLAGEHTAQVTRLRKRLSEARLRVQQAHAAEAQERRERRMAESARDSLTKQLDQLRAGSGSPRSLTMSSRHGHSDVDAGDEGSIDGCEMLSPLRPNGITHTSSLALDEMDLGAPDYSELSMEVSVQVPNDGAKLVSVEDTVTVQEIIETLCEVNGLSDPEGYCMYIDEDNFGATKATAKSHKSSRGRKFDIWKRKSSAEEPQLTHGAVLNNECTLDQQGICPHPQLLLHLKRRSEIMANSDLDSAETLSIDDESDNEFIKCKDELAEGRLLCTHKEAVNMLAFFAQAMYGSQSQLNKDQLKGIAEAMKDAVTCVSLKTKHVKKLMHQYSMLTGMSFNQAKKRFVQLCKGLQTYNARVYHVKERVSKKEKGKQCILALTPRNMYKLDEKTKEILATWAMKNIFRAHATGELLTIEAYHTPTLIVSTSESSDISAFIHQYHHGLAPEQHSVTPSLTVTEPTPKHSPLRQTLSNNTIVHSSPKNSPRLAQQLSIRRTESATVIRKVSPGIRVSQRSSDSQEALHRIRSQSTSSATKPVNLPKKKKPLKASPTEGDSDSSEDTRAVVGSLPTFGGSNPLLSSTGRNHHHHHHHHNHGQVSSPHKVK
ncbi:uncharacterized protein LOC135817447 [Sycon ciliatum]|uniref:uncharacterized protein LOC135817447 n=1 Tax=Sycon ciliatum TaxID=27933 RepID=UPI0031F6ED79